MTEKNIKIYKTIIIINNNNNNNNNNNCDGKNDKKYIYIYIDVDNILKSFLSLTMITSSITCAWTT